MKIYISATYRDLREHRQAVATVLRRMGHQVIGMEDYVAEGVRPLHRCLDDVKACDVYVGIFAWRYGSPAPEDVGIPSSQLPLGTVPGTTSMTEFEFRQAVECGDKPVLVFLLDPDAPWPANQFDAIGGTDDPRGGAIARLRQEISQQYLIDYFRTPEDLASRVSTAVYRAEMSRQMSLESLNITVMANQPFEREGALDDSTLRQIVDMITGEPEIQALEINIGRGYRWWMTRLYFLSSLAADLTTIETMVFTNDDRTFLGITDPRIVKERLAQAHSTIGQYEERITASSQIRNGLQNEVDERAKIWEQLMTATGGERSRQVFVTKRELDRWLGPYLITRAIDREPDDNEALQMQRLIDWPMRFVPVVEGGRFARIVDKQALAEQIARLYIRGQVSRVLSTIR